MKTCTVCKQEKTLECFPLDPRRLGGLGSNCRRCVQKSGQKSREKYKEHYERYGKAYLSKKVSGNQTYADYLLIEKQRLHKIRETYRTKEE